MSQRPSAATASTAAASTSTHTSVASGATSRAAARESLPAWPAPRTQTVAAPDASDRTCDAAAQTSNNSSALSSGTSAGINAQPVRSKRYAVPVTSTWGESGSTWSTDSSRSGISVSDARLATRVADLGRIGDAVADRRDRAEQDPAGVGLGVVHLAAVGDDLDDQPAIRSGLPPPRSCRSRCDVESRHRRSTATSTS